jgi:putative endonuclease
MSAVDRATGCGHHGGMAGFPWLRRLLGNRGERAAERFLSSRGLRIIARGLRTRRGELDLVALDGRQVVFIEVKTRLDHQAGHPAEAVDAAKQRKLVALALQFLKKHGLLDHSARFDIVAVTWPADRAEPVIEHYRNAFESPDRFQMFS